MKISTNTYLVKATETGLALKKKLYVTWNPYVLILSHIIASYIWFLIVVPGRVPVTMRSRLQFPMRLCNVFVGIEAGDGLKFYMDTVLNISYHSVTRNSTKTITATGSRPTSEYKLIFDVIRAVDVIVCPGFCVGLTVICVINGNTITKINHVAVVRPQTCSVSVHLSI